MESAQHPKPVDLDKEINPELKKTLDGMKPAYLTKETLEATRKYILEVAAEVQKKLPHDVDDIGISTRYIPGPKNPKDSPDVYVKVYRKKGDNSVKPGFLWIYGGGMVMNKCDSYDYMCQKVAQQTDCVVVNVGYRLAPEHPYPAAVEDCYAALSFMKDSAEELGIDADRIVVFGQSSGGGLVAALSVLARDRGGPKISLQMPLYPMLDCANNSPSAYEIQDPRVWNQAKNQFAWDSYLGDLAKADLKDIPPYASASRTVDYAGLPPTFIFIGTLDVFRDETIAYVSKLAQAQVPVEFHLYPGCFHGFDIVVPEAKVSQEADALMFGAIKKAFAKKDTQ